MNSPLGAKGGMNQGYSAYPFVVESCATVRTHLFSFYSGNIRRIRISQGKIDNFHEKQF